MGPRRHRPEVAVRAVTRTARAVAGAAAPALLALVAAASLGRAQGRAEEVGHDEGDRRVGDCFVRSFVRRFDRAFRRSRSRRIARAPTAWRRCERGSRRIATTTFGSSSRSTIEQLWAIIGPDTLLTAPIAVSTDETLEYAGKSWRFETPRGVRTVHREEGEPRVDPARVALRRGRAASTGSSSRR